MREPVEIEFGRGTTRLQGANRYATAAEISKRYPAGVAAAFVATGGAFPDALSAASAAAHLESPILLTNRNSLPDETRSALRRLSPEVIYVVGGPNAVSPQVENTLKQIAPVKRIGAADRYGTSLATSRQIFTSSSFAVIATGVNFPDALAASGVAGSKSAPVVLVKGRAATVPSNVIAELRRLGVKNVMIAGGNAVVSAGIQSQLRGAGFSVTRRGGADRYATAVAINKAHFPAGSARNVFLATGASFPDALAGAAMAGLTDSPLYISKRACMPTEVLSAINALGAQSRVVLGGTVALSNAAANGTKCASKPAPAPVKPPVATGPPAGARIVHAGAFCARADAGKVGYTSTGLKKVCKTSAADSRLRWR